MSELFSSNEGVFPQIVFCTLSKALVLLQNRLLFKWKNKFGRLVYRQSLLVDEASVVSLLSMFQILPFLPYFKSLVFAGDPKQGSPDCAGSYEPVSVIDLLEEHISLEEVPFVKNTFLDIQYRMQKDMGDIISGTFYNGRLQSFKMAPQQGSCFFLDLEARWYTRDTSRYCPDEEMQALRIVRALTKKYPEKEVVVLTFFSGQVDYFKYLCEKASNDVMFPCCTVDAYQGKQAHFMVLLICCCPPKKPSKFICNRKRVNVALSRARVGLVVIGNLQNIELDTTWKMILRSFTEGTDIGKFL